MMKGYRPNTLSAPPPVAIVIVIYADWSRLRWMCGLTEPIAEELVVVDNGGLVEDRHGALADAWQTAATTVRLVTTADNWGYGRAANFGVRQTASEFLIVMNDDVEISRDAIALLVTALRSDPTIRMVAPQLMHPDGSYQRTLVPWPRLRDFFLEAIGLDWLWPSGYLMDATTGTQEPISYDGPSRDAYLGGACLMIAREHWLAVNGFPEQFLFYGEDVAIGYEVTRKLGAVAVVPAATAIHFGQQTSHAVPMLRRRLLAAKADLMFFELYRGKVASRLYLLAMLLRGILRIAGPRCDREALTIARRLIATRGSARQDAILDVARRGIQMCHDKRI